MKEKTNSRSKAKRVLYMALLSLATVGATLVARHPIQAPCDEGGAEAAIRPEAKRRAQNHPDPRRGLVLRGLRSNVHVLASAGDNAMEPIA